MTININLDPEFEIACDLLYLRPEEAIHAFIQNVSLANFYSSDACLTQKNINLKKALPINIQNQEKEDHSRPKSLLNQATGFLLEYNARYNKRLLPANKTQKKYLKEFDNLLSQIINEPNLEVRYFRLAGFFYEWREAILLKISKHDAIINVNSKRIKLNT